MKPSHSAADFIVRDCNRRAWESIQRDGCWPQNRLLLIGPAGSGKSHLTGIWARRNRATIAEYGALSKLSAVQLIAQGQVAVENVFGGSDPHCERTLFSLIELSASMNRQLMISSSLDPRRCKIALPDLRSRIDGTHFVRLDSPDSEFLAALLVKLFADRQLSVARGTIHYIVARMERSHFAAGDLVDRLDRMSLARGKPVSKSMARDGLTMQGREMKEEVS